MKFKTYLAEEKKAQPKAQAMVYDFNRNQFKMTVLESGQVILVSRGMPHALSNIVFNHPGGYADKDAAVKRIAQSAKNSKDLADKLNQSGLGYDNWKPL